MTVHHPWRSSSIGIRPNCLLNLITCQFIAVGPQIYSVMYGFAMESRYVMRSSKCDKLLTSTKLARKGMKHGRFIEGCGKGQLRYLYRYHQVFVWCRITSLEYISLADWPSNPVEAQIDCFNAPSSWSGLVIPCSEQPQYVSRFKNILVNISYDEGSWLIYCNFRLSLKRFDRSLLDFAITSSVETLKIDEPSQLLSVLLESQTKEWNATFRDSGFTTYLAKVIQWPNVVNALRRYPTIR